MSRTWYLSLPALLRRLWWGWGDVGEDCGGVVLCFRMLIPQVFFFFFAFLHFCIFFALSSFYSSFHPLPSYCLHLSLNVTP